MPAQINLIFCFLFRFRLEVFPLMFSIHRSKVCFLRIFCFLILIQCNTHMDNRNWLQYMYQRWNCRTDEEEDGIWNELRLWSLIDKQRSWECQFIWSSWDWDGWMENEKIYSHYHYHNQKQLKLWTGCNLTWCIYFPEKSWNQTQPFEFPDSLNNLNVTLFTTKITNIKITLRCIW